MRKELQSLQVQQAIFDIQDVPIIEELPVDIGPAFHLADNIPHQPIISYVPEFCLDKSLEDYLSVIKVDAMVVVIEPFRVGYRLEVVLCNPLRYALVNLFQRALLAAAVWPRNMPNAIIVDDQLLELLSIFLQESLEDIFLLKHSF